MEVIEKVIPYRRGDSFFLYLLGDTHLGTIHCAEEEAREKVREIKENDRAYWVGMGDYAESITPRDKRWEPNRESIPEWVEQDNIAECQKKRVVSLFEPIKDKCVGLLYGNHEDNIRRFNHDNIQKNICDALEVPNLGYSCFVHFTFRRVTEAHRIKGHFTHGTGSARTEGGRVNYLVRTMSAFDANIYGYGHTHGMQLYSPEILGTSDNLIVKSKGKIGALTGCWFRAYTQGQIASYGEAKVYAPNRIGCPVFIITPNKGTIEARTPPIEY